MWTDVIQLVVIMTSMLASIVQGVINAGGVTNVVERALKGGRIDVISFSPDLYTRYTFWGALVSHFMSMLAMYGTSQYLVQRYLAAPTLKVAQRTVWWNIPGNIIIITLGILMGVVVYATYCKCDPLKTKRIEAIDQIFPLFVMDSFSQFKGMPGLFVAGLFSASLSTVSSLLNSLSAVTTEDYFKSINYFKKLGDNKLAILSKISTAIYGVVCVLLVLLVARIGTLTAASSSISGCTMGILLAVFSCGIFFPWIHSLEVLISLPVGLVIGLWFAFTVPNATKDDYRLPVSTEECLVRNFTSQLVELGVNATKPPAQATVLDLVKISYLWLNALATSMIILMAHIVWIFRVLLRKQEKKELEKTYYSPPVVWIINKIQRKRKKQDEPSNSSKF